jgi:hypothetical protein
MVVNEIVKKLSESRKASVFLSPGTPAKKTIQVLK